MYELLLRSQGRTKDKRFKEIETSKMDEKIAEVSDFNP